MRFAHSRTGLFVALGVLSSLSCACGSDDIGGACYVEKGDFIGADTGYVWSSMDYCSSKSKCHDFCDSVKDLDNWRSCGWQSADVCTSGELPAASAAYFCAISLSVTCGGEPSSTVQCFGECASLANTSDYDVSTDCLSQYAATYGEGTNCSDAMADLGGNLGQDTDPAQGGDTSSESCDFETPYAACNDCIKTACNAECAKCSADQDCVSLASCENKCSDSTCFGTCEQDTPNGTAPLKRFSECITNHCADTCTTN